MQRDPRLQGLSSDHHHALVLARQLERGELTDVNEVRTRFDAELAPHFAVEELLLLPALDEAGDGALSARVRSEHEALRELLERGDLVHFAHLLSEHVRFEERELFRECEARLAPAVLDAVAARRPHPRR